jgi:glycosyltransferase involved in cell wall biosynthesis
LTSVLIVSHEALQERMSGPSIRNWELAGALSGHHRVTFAAPGEPERASSTFEVRGYDAGSLPELVTAHEVVQASGYLLDRHPVLGRARRLVVDLYDPFPLENLHLHETAPIAEQHRIAAADRDVLTRLIQAADVFLCASERQRDFWMGWLAVAGRVNPFVHRADPGLARLLRLVPFGISEVPPRAGPPTFRGVLPGVQKDDFLVLWGGGIWNWFDPLTLIRAASRLRHRLPNLRVIFPAVASPSTEVLPMAMAAEAQRLSAELGLTGSVVFFGGGWVPYAQRGNMLLEADVGVSLHREDVETRYSFRTRVLDYLWAGLPILTTEGDSMADLVREADLGVVVPYEDVDAAAAGLVALAEDRERLRECGRRSREVAAGFLWSEVAKPLIAYCDDPVPAPDRGQPKPAILWPNPEPVAQLGGLLERAARAYRQGGIALIARKTARRVRRKLRRGER